MPSREINLPDDLEEMAQMATDSFQYPENPSWSIQEDEKESIVESFQSLRRSWWMLRIGQLFMPGMRDLLNGLLWEEDGKIVSIVMIQKRGSSNNWMVNTVATLPEYRRRGYARKLVEGSLDLMRSRGAEIAVLDVIDANYPAYTLYENIGFEHFSGQYELEYKPSGVHPTQEWPAELVLEPTNVFNWQARYELIKRISPESIQKYEPVDEARFHSPTFLRVMYPILTRAQKMKSEVYLVRLAENNQVIGYFFLDIRTNHKGRHSLSMRLDPAYKQYSTVLVEQAVHQLTQADPDLFIEMGGPSWQQHLADAALEFGFSQRILLHRMGIKL